MNFKNSNFTIRLFAHKKLWIFLLILSIIILFKSFSILKECKNYSIMNPEQIRQCLLPNNNLLPNNIDEIQSFKQVNNLKVTALIFYGRKRYVEILSKYLIANLKSNGGVLDHVKFAVRTKVKSDIEYLDSLISQYPNEFKKYDFQPDIRYTLLYKLLDDNELVFKIDDDVLFIKNGTLDSMVKEYLANEHMVLSANVVNNGRFSLIHSQINAFKPLKKKFHLIEYYKRLENCSFEMDRYNALNNWWRSGECAELVHEAFFSHFKANRLNVYDYGLYDLHLPEYHRFSINFFLTLGKFINKIDLINYKHIYEGEDELKTSVLIPKTLNMHVFSLGKAIISHYGYYTQRDYLDKKTNVLERYKNLAEIYFGQRKEIQDH